MSSVVILQIVVAVSSFATAQTTNETALYRTAVEKLGAASKVWILEPGDSGLSRWEPRRWSEDSGVILEWDSKNLKLLRPESEAETTIVGDEVVRIEPSSFWEAGENVRKRIDQGEFEAAIRDGQAALKSAKGVARWRQRILVAQMVEAAVSAGKMAEAGSIFCFLAKENPPQLLLSTIPLPWSDEATTAGPAVTKLAEKWIDDDNPAIALLGASWLLSGSSRTKAIETLEALSKNERALIAAYAQSQLWRTVPPSTIQSEHLPQWIAQRDSMLVPIQAGPTMLLAERLQQAGQPALAIPEWIRVATLHKDRMHLSRKAAANAQAALRSMGRTDEADKLATLNAR